jgi:hypothetical protein
MIEIVKKNCRCRRAHATVAPLGCHSPTGRGSRFRTAVSVNGERAHHPSPYVDVQKILSKILRWILEQPILCGPCIRLVRQKWPCNTRHSNTVIQESNESLAPPKNLLRFSFLSGPATYTSIRARTPYPVQVPAPCSRLLQSDGNI